MNKKNLKSYWAGLKPTKTNEALKDRFTYYNDNYLISNSYSIIKLNSVHDTLRPSNNQGISEQLKRLYEDFGGSDGFGGSFNSTFKTIDLDILNSNENDNIIAEYDQYTVYSVNIKLLKKIYNLIKFDTITYKEKYTYKWQCVIYLENSKTKENAYLMPCIVV